MDYSSPVNQIYALMHYLFAFLLLLAIWPSYFLSYKSEDKLERRIALFCQAVCIYITIVYIPVSLQLYEVISVVIVLLLLSTWRFWKKGSDQLRQESVSIFSVWFYNFLEVGFRLKNNWKRFTGKLTMIRKDIYLNKQVSGDPLAMILLFITLSVTAYVRFYDAAHTAAPAMSDGVVTLAWMKYINARLLFEDEIYPQGFHIILSLLSKFAAIDQLYILKYSGPLNGVLTALVLYFVVSRLTGNKYAGMVGAALFGFGSEWLFGSDWTRQAATNSQEFALIFAFPACYFILKYYQTKLRSDLIAGLAACCVTGFVHTLVFAFTGMAIGISIIACLLVPQIRSWKSMITVSIGSIGAVVLTYAPIQLALWSGLKYNESAEDFLVSTAEIAYPILLTKDYVGLGSIVLIVLSMIFRWRDRTNRLAEWFALGIGTATFLLYYAAPTLTNSILLASRSGTLWMMSICFCTGFAWWSIWRILPTWKPIRYAEIIIYATAAAVFAGYVDLKPITTYKMQWESAARMYLEISSKHLNKTWTIFSNEEDFALVYGNGWHQMLSVLIEQYDPTGTPITRIGQDEYDADVTPMMYVFQEKNVYKVPPNNSVYEIMQERYARREENNRNLEKWLDAYVPIHGRPPIVYEDDNLRVYLILRPDAEDKEIRRLWGN